jgi:hypothetical protein
VGGNSSHITKNAEGKLNLMQQTLTSRFLFTELEILPFASPYVLSLMLFVAKNRNEFIVNSEIHGINTRQNNLHQPLANLRKYQKGIT